VSKEPRAAPVALQRNAPAAASQFEHPHAPLLSPNIQTWPVPAQYAVCVCRLKGEGALSKSRSTGSSHPADRVRKSVLALCNTRQQPVLMTPSLTACWFLMHHMLCYHLRLAFPSVLFASVFTKLYVQLLSRIAHATQGTSCFCLSQSSHGVHSDQYIP
jgi:hypothetical protein